MSEIVNVICIKWGQKFKADEVNVLYSMVKRHLKRDHSFVCFTDNDDGLDQGIETFPLPEIDIPAEKMVSPWRKIGIFNEKLGDLKGWTLFLDLDVVVMGGLDDLFDYAIKQDKMNIIENWTQMGRGVGNSSVYAFEVGRYKDLLAYFNANKQEVFDTYPNSQTLQSRYIDENLGGITYWPKEWCQSFKVHCRPVWPMRYIQTPRKPDPDCRVLAFHGDPGVTEAMNGGFAGAKWQKYNRPTPWIADFYK